MSVEHAFVIGLAIGLLVGGYIGFACGDGQ